MQQSEAWRDLDQRLRAMQDLLRGSGLSDPNLPLALFALKCLIQEPIFLERLNHWSEQPVDRMSDLRSVEELAGMFEDTMGWEDRPFTKYLLGDLSRVGSGIGSELLSQLDSPVPPTEVAPWLHERAHSIGLQIGNNTPRELAQMMASLASFDSASRVFDPSCGTGSLLLAARQTYNNHPAIVGNELNGYARSWTRVRLAVSGLWDADLAPTEPWKAPWGADKFRPAKRYDVVLSNPPFGAQLQVDHIQHTYDCQYLAAHSKSGRMPSELAYLLTAYHHLAENGTAAILVPLGVLFRAGMDLSVRKALVDEGAIDAVIALPARLSAPVTAIETAIMVLRRPTPGKSDVSTLLIDARQLGVRRGQKVVLDEAATGKILHVYRHRTVEPGFSTVAETSDIIAQDFNLAPSRYIEQLPTATVDVSARRDHIATLDRHSQQLLDEYEVLIEALMLDARQRQ